MTGRLKGRTALVFGAARGIGEGIAARFVAEGAKVLVADQEASASRATADRLGRAARFVEADVTRPADVEHAVATAVEIFGTLDILVQNAGI
jgi:3-oxoacyl-[acyl-carrier protein] reductase